MASTPVVNDMPFKMLSSTIVSPQEGPSASPQSCNLEASGADPVKKSFSKLLSVDDDDDDERGTQGTALDGSDGGKKTFPINQFPFSIGSRPIGPPQKFFATQKRPSFKVSSFVSSSPLLPCGSSSSFYPGKTSYGGVSSLQSRNVKRQKMSPVASDVPRKTSRIRPKQFSSAQGVTSDTARKILGALERMSSPVADASRLPRSSSSVLFKPSRSKPDQSVNLFSFKPSPHLPPASSVNISRNVNIQFREKTNEPFRFETGIIRPSAPVGTFKSQRLPTAFSPDDDYKGGGKIRRQRQQCHYSATEKKSEESVNTLPEIHTAPTLVVSSLPKFDFGVSTASKPKQMDLKGFSVENKAESISEKTPSGRFTFSQPEVISEKSERGGGDVPEASFQFSVPTVKENEIKNEKFDNDSPKVDLTKELKDDGPLSKPCLSTRGIPKESSKTLSNKSNNSECDTTTHVDSEGTTASISHKSVIPCDKNTKSPGHGNKLTLANKFKAPEGSWECSLCMLINSAESSLCKACNAKRTGGNIDNSQKTNASSREIGTKGSLLDKFKKTDGAWDCSTCMLSNKKNDSKCVACGSKKSAELLKSEPLNKGPSLKVKFGAQQEGSWECEVCMLQNKPNVTECISCKAPKPGTQSVPKPALFPFDTNGQKGSVAFGTGDSSTSVTFGTNTGVNVGTGILFNSSGTGGFKFGSGENKTPVINFGTGNGTGGFFGSNQATSSTMFGTGVGFSFGAPKDTFEPGTEAFASSSKTEENNNLSNSRVVFATSPIKQLGNKVAVSPAKETPNDLAGKEKIISIADAAQAGLLKVPELEKKNISTSVVNGPELLNFSAPKPLKFGSYLSDDNTSKSFASSSTSNSFKFSTNSPEKDQKLLPVFSFAKPVMSQEQTSTAAGFSSGSNNLFSFKSMPEQPSGQLTSQSKEPSPFEKLNPSIETEMPVKSSLGSNSTFAFHPEGQFKTPSANQVKLPSTSGTSIFAAVATSETSAHSNFVESTAQSTGGSLFQVPDKLMESKVNSSSTFNFSTETNKPLSGIFAQNSESNSVAANENKSGINMKVQNTFFGSNSSGAETNKNLFGSNPFANATSPPSNTIGTSNALSGTKFNFSSNSNTLPNIFGSQQIQRTELGQTSGFNFSALPTTTGTSLKTVNSTDDKPKPFSFVTPSNSQGPALFSFGSSTVNANVPSSALSTNFNFGTVTNSDAVFSPVVSSSVPPSGRPMKRGVRRKK